MNKSEYLKSLAENRISGRSQRESLLTEPSWPTESHFQINGGGGRSLNSPSPCLDPDREETFWREHYRQQSWSQADRGVEEFLPALRVGWEGYQTFGSPQSSFAEVEPKLKMKYENQEGKRLPWLKARSAAEAAWRKVQAEQEKNGG